jgi:hypothetical protein
MSLVALLRGSRVSHSAVRRNARYSRRSDMSTDPAVRALMLRRLLTHSRTGFGTPQVEAL